MDKLFTFDIGQWLFSFVLHDNLIFVFLFLNSCFLPRAVVGIFLFANKLCKDKHNEKTNTKQSKQKNETAFIFDSIPTTSFFNSFKRSTTNFLVFSSIPFETVAPTKCGVNIIHQSLRKNNFLFLLLLFLLLLLLLLLLRSHWMDYEFHYIYQCIYTKLPKFSYLLVI